MAWLKKIAASIPGLKSLFDPDAWSALLEDGCQTAAGVHVGPETALRCTPVYAGTRVRCETLASLPIHLYARLGNGNRRRADDHPL